MKPNKKTRKSFEGDASVDRDNEKWSKNNKGKITDEFQESLREDMRGPLEGMEAVPKKQ